MVPGFERFAWLTFDDCPLAAIIPENSTGLVRILARNSY